MSKPIGNNVLVINSRLENNILKHLILIAIINISVCISLLGLYDFATYIERVTVVHFVLAFTLAEFILKDYMFRYLLVYIVKSYGFLLILTTGILMILFDVIVFEDFVFVNEYSFLVFVLLFSFVRQLIVMVYTTNKRNKVYRKLLSGRH